MSCKNTYSFINFEQILCEMPRPQNKEALQHLSKENYAKLMGFVQTFSIEQQEKDFPEGTLNRNIRDVLAHLHHWHLLMLNWYHVGMKGEKPAMPAEGYSWRTLPDYNIEVQKKYAEISLNESKTLLDSSFKKLQDLIESHSNDELFEKKRYKWTGSTSLGAYLISNTSSHYDWAYKLIKKQTKSWEKS